MPSGTRQAHDAPLPGRFYSAEKARRMLPDRVRPGASKKRFSCFKVPVEPARSAVSGPAPDTAYKPAPDVFVLEPPADAHRIAAGIHLYVPAQTGQLEKRRGKTFLGQLHPACSDARILYHLHRRAACYYPARGFPPEMIPIRGRGGNLWGAGSAKASQ